MKIIDYIYVIFVFVSLSANAEFSANITRYDLFIDQKESFPSLDAGSNAHFVNATRLLISDPESEQIIAIDIDSGSQQLLPIHDVRDFSLQIEGDSILLAAALLNEHAIHLFNNKHEEFESEIIFNNEQIRIDQFFIMLNPYKLAFSHHKNILVALGGSAIDKQELYIFIKTTDHWGYCQKIATNSQRLTDIEPVSDNSFIISARDIDTLFELTPSSEHSPECGLFQLTPIVLSVNLRNPERVLTISDGFLGVITPDQLFIFYKSDAIYQIHDKIRLNIHPEQVTGLAGGFVDDASLAVFISSANRIDTFFFAIEEQLVQRTQSLTGLDFDVEQHLSPGFGELALYSGKLTKLAVTRLGAINILSYLPGPSFDQPEYHYQLNPNEEHQEDVAIGAVVVDFHESPEPDNQVMLDLYQLPFYWSNNTLWFNATGEPFSQNSSLSLSLTALNSRGQKNTAPVIVQIVPPKNDWLPIAYIGLPVIALGTTGVAIYALASHLFHGYKHYKPNMNNDEESSVTNTDTDFPKQPQVRHSVQKRPFSAGSGSGSVLDLFKEQSREVPIEKTNSHHSSTISVETTTKQTGAGPVSQAQSTVQRQDSPASTESSLEQAGSGSDPQTQSTAQRQDASDDTSTVIANNVEIGFVAKRTAFHEGVIEQLAREQADAYVSKSNNKH